MTTKGRDLLVIDDRPDELRDWINIVSQSGFYMEIHIFKDVQTAVNDVELKDPAIVLVGHGLSSFPITGSDVVRALRKAGYNGIIVCNSGGGSLLFEKDGVSVDFSTDRNPNKLSELLERYENGSL